MKDKKILFMGTPEYAVPVLERLIESCNVIGAVTQPDKEVGRKKILTPSPVKVVAEKHGIKVFQPVKLRKEYQELIDLNVDMIITCAYGQILPQELLDYPKYKTINVHGSLLPKLRGGAPIQRAIMNGDKVTGITIMKTDAGMDSGDIILKEEVKIEDNDNYETLANKMSIVGANLLMKVLPDIFEQKVKYIKQDDKDVTFAPIIKKEDEYLVFNKSSIEVLNQIRGLSPDPACYFILNDERIKVYEGKIGNGKDTEFGKIINIYKDGIGISTLDGEIIITKIQVPGKKIMLVRDYLNGINKNELLNKKIL